MIAITDVVRCIEPFWDEDSVPFPQPAPDPNRLFIVAECHRSGCKILDMKTGGSEAWWDYRKLEKVRDGSFEELDEVEKKSHKKFY